MKMQKVKSSNIKAVGYDEITQKMRVEFFSGGLYEYDKVPRNTFLAFMKAESLGKYFHKNIRGKFDTKPVPKS